MTHATLVPESHDGDYTPSLDPDLLARATPPKAKARVERRKRARSWASPSTYVFMMLSFMLMFTASTTVVLGAWFAFQRPIDRLLARAPATVAAPAPPAVVTPPPAPVDPGAEDLATLVKAAQGAPVEPPGVPAEPEVSAPAPVVAAPAPVRRADRPEPTPPEAPVEPAVQPTPTPTPTRTAAVPVRPPTPPRPNPGARFTGSYIGKAAGKPVEIDLTFLADNLVEGTVRAVAGDSGVTSGAAKGNYSIQADGSVTVALVAGDSIYSGTLVDGQVSGRVTIDGRNKGKFVVAR